MNRTTTSQLWTFFAVYLALIALILFFHEPWRDEVVIVNMVRESSSLADFWTRTQNYGHPRLWYLLIYFGYSVFPDYSVIKYLNFAVCGTAMFVFLRHAPFSAFHKILFSIGFFPLYLYPAFSRNYGLCWLLIMVLAAIWKDRWTHPLRIAGTLVLLMFTHVHMMIVALAVTAGLAWEWIFLPSARRNDRAAAALAAVTAGAALTVWQILPDSSTTLTKVHHTSTIQILKAFAINLLSPGKIFDKVFGVPSGLFSSLVLWTAAFHFFNRRPVFIAFSLGTIGLGMFSLLVYPSDTLRHQGAVFLLLLWSIWTYQTDETPVRILPKRLQTWHDQLTHKAPAFATMLLILQVCAAYPAARKDIAQDFSSNKALSAFLNQRPDLRNAIFLPCPDYILESALYYEPMLSVYLPRESTFKTYIAFTSAGRRDFSLKELLETGRRLTRETGRPVVFAVSPSMLEIRRTTPLPHGQTFEVSEESLKEFHESAERLTSFDHALSDENYDLYLLKQGASE